MIGGIEETSASFEAWSAPRSYPTTLSIRALVAVSLRSLACSVIACICAWMNSICSVARPFSQNGCFLALAGQDA